MDTINTELILADLQTVEKAIPRLEKEARIKKDVVPQLEAVREAQKVLDGGQTVFAAGLDRGPLRELHLLTAKPFLYVFNLDEDELTDAALRAELACAGRARPRPSSSTRRSRWSSSRWTRRTRLELLQSMGQQESGLHQLARHRVRHPRAADLPDGWARRRPAPGPSRRARRRPRPAESSTPTSSAGSSRPRSSASTTSSSSGRSAAARAAGKARMEGKDYVHAGRRRGGVPLQRLVPVVQCARSAQDSWTGTASGTTVQTWPSPRARRARTSSRCSSRCNDDRTPVEITSKKGNAVLIGQDEYDALVETAHLLRPCERRRLLET
jgi:hypothetical protein